MTNFLFRKYLNGVDLYDPDKSRAATMALFPTRRWRDRAAQPDSESARRRALGIRHRATLADLQAALARYRGPVRYLKPGHAKGALRYCVGGDQYDEWAGIG